jgi:purine-cytosine permease-like protein
MFGYQYVSKFANIAAPWMILVFFAAGIAILPQLGVTSLSNFWEVANDKIWTGIPLAGQSKFTFLHVMFFAWFANMAMHIGMSDLTIFRYAKKWQYGFSSATGMYIGHYFAWLAAGILYAVVLVGVVPEGQTIASYLPGVSQGDLPSPAPGPLAYNAAGLAGVICVVIAGWTTANPTIYRAGLALQSVLPKLKTWKTTLITGLVTTIAACFPALVMKLLSFVAIYGFVLMPMGAVIFIDFYMMKRFGLTSFYAEKAGININWAAGLAWILTLVAGLLAYLFMGVEEFFLGLPGWFVAAILYIVISKIIQKPEYITT